MKWVLPVMRGLFALLKGIPNNTNQSLIRDIEEYALDPTDRHRTRYFQELLGSFWQCLPLRLGGLNIGRTSSGIEFCLIYTETGREAHEGCTQ